MLTGGHAPQRRPRSCALRFVTSGEHSVGKISNRRARQLLLQSIDRGRRGLAQEQEGYARRPTGVGAVRHVLRAQNPAWIGRGTQSADERKQQIGSLSPSQIFAWRQSCKAARRERAPPRQSPYRQTYRTSPTSDRAAIRAFRRRAAVRPAAELAPQAAADEAPAAARPPLAAVREPLAATVRGPPVGLDEAREGPPLVRGNAHSRGRRTRRGRCWRRGVSGWRRRRRSMQGCGWRRRDDSRLWRRNDRPESAALASAPGQPVRLPWPL